MRVQIKLPNIKLEVKQLAELRKQLHVLVDGAWAKPEMLDAKDELSAAAKEYGECLKKLWDEGRVSIEEYRKCAQTHNIGETYKEKWGKK